MLTRRFVTLLVSASLLGIRSAAEPAPFPIRELQTSRDSDRATIRVFAEQRAAYRIPREITGKFAEHLGWNIYNGMDAQILRNPTFADYPFGDGQLTPDGVVKFQTDEPKINDELRRQGTRFGWPAATLDGLVQAHADALAAFWTRQGPREQVQVSPDTGPFGGRAQRVEVKRAGQGIAQWTWLPLHRQRQYEFELMVRSPDAERLTVALWELDGGKPVCSASLDGVANEWKKLRATFSVPEHVAADRSYKLTLTSETPGQFVLRHAFL